MPHRPLSLHAPRGSIAAEELRAGIDALLADHEGGVPLEFPAQVLAAAEAAAERSHSAPGRADRTDVPFVTLDPDSSTDLDQAMHLARTEAGFRVLYAIADVPSFVALDGPIDHEARRRGETLYLPDRRIPLHPEVLSEGAASLLPQQITPAFVWVLDLDESGEVVGIDLERALVRSVAKLAYDQVQEELDRGEGHPMMLLLQEIGALRTALESRRGGASLNVPEQEVVAEDGAVHLTWRRPHPIEDANAQLSLMTGMAAAQLMLEHGAGILRTMPPAEPAAVDRFRRQSEALGAPWPADQRYGDFLRSLDWRDPVHLALLNQATSLFRGASYAAFTRAEELPEDVEQSAIAAPYAHTTAPLRRLVDRFVLLVCHAHARGERPAPELLAALGEIPEAMQSTGVRAGNLERAALELVETAALAAWVGETMEATVIERREASGDGNGDGAPTRVEIQLSEPPVTAWVPMDAAPGERVRVRLDSVEPRARFVPADGAEPA
ncbi:RNB domain-containing ribonuclease [Brachybacterium saurashtrense]|uniref:RNB domain-containing ribonuclease n=1 Tax=Brachybacterium saurashtrense TaxID=556288 RepID=A0A345YMF8_9MICO|nr:RNB domain-containing ribonuclease [Brachybacterium saurashtrense]AXK45110.1 RNB domain-containing ribonuclease [Brachybacterium saurashtrense]RRR22137.1 RNB domain-containing ribonuclease [Brachybacterium saurashtrense]